jgi:hypothetical protein
MSNVQLVNCRRPFGGSLSWDAIVEGSYPDRQSCLVLSQSDVAGCAYLNIPFATLDCAQAVINAVSSYHLCSLFGDGVISVSLAWENAPAIEFSLTL